LIAGGGPVGMTLACELSRRGIECMLVERNATTTHYPKMDITNARSMELFRRLALVNALRSVAVPEDNNFDVSWVTSLTGHELHRFRYPSVNEWRRLICENNDGSMPGEAPMRVSQVEIEPVLQRAVKALPGVEARWGVAFKELTQDAEGVTATLCAADGAAKQIRCHYLVGCDEDVGRTVKDFDWIVWIIVHHPKFTIGADGRVRWPDDVSVTPEPIDLPPPDPGCLARSKPWRPVHQRPARDQRRPTWKKWER
jgi:hypothetical protein